jgi:hypothetical protein
VIARPVATPAPPRAAALVPEAKDVDDLDALFEEIQLED